MAYPDKPTGNDILPTDSIFADNNLHRNQYIL